jgi:hypothetical protein
MKKKKLKKLISKIIRKQTQQPPSKVMSLVDHLKSDNELLALLPMKEAVLPKFTFKKVE